MPRIDAVSVTSTDMPRSVAFYTLLGFDFTGVETGGPHVEPQRAEGSHRLMIDDAGLMQDLTGRAPSPASHASFAMVCADAAEVDTLADRVAAAGFTVETPPWDAPWGQRYAVVADPSGYRVDLFAPLP